jgi:hypothetical protein
VTMITASKVEDEGPEDILRGRASKLILIDAVPNPSTVITALFLALWHYHTTKSLLAIVLLPLEVPKFKIPEGKAHTRVRIFGTSLVGPCTAGRGNHFLRSIARPHWIV